MLIRPYFTGLQLIQQIQFIPLNRDGKHLEELPVIVGLSIGEVIPLRGEGLKVVQFMLLKHSNDLVDIVFNTLQILFNEHSLLKIDKFASGFLVGGVLYYEGVSTWGMLWGVVDNHRA